MSRGSQNEKHLEQMEYTVKKSQGGMYWGCSIANKETVRLQLSKQRKSNRTKSER